MREGYEETDDETTDEVVKFWQKMMKRYGSEEEYTKQLINQFKHGSEPEILIVVDKLLTGFDAPRNAVLYLCRVLREHTLLQAIARVNRLHEGKEFGFIVDYASVLGELDKALTMYSAFEGFDESDLVGTLTSINSEIENCPAGIPIFGIYSKRLSIPTMKKPMKCCLPMMNSEKSFMAAFRSSENPCYCTLFREIHDRNR